MSFTDRIILGNHPAIDDNSGVWVSKPNVNVSAVAGNTYLAGLSDWYSWHEEFDFTNLVDGSYVYEDAEPYGSGFATIPNSSGVTDTNLISKIARQPEGTLKFTAAPGVQNLYTKRAVINGKPSSDDSILGVHYPTVEMRLRRTSDSHPALPNTSLKLYWTLMTIDGEHEITGDGDYSVNTPTIDGSTISDYADIDTLFPVNTWRSLEWDLSSHNGWIDAAHAAHPVPGGAYSSGEYRAIQLRFDLIDDDAYTNPGAEKNDIPLFEIDYVRVKRPSIPRNFSPHDNSKDSMFIDTDAVRYGSVHQSGFVQIGTGRAKIDGLAEITNGKDRADPDARGTNGCYLGHVEFQPLPYVPVVIFQRYDPSSNTVYPAGEKEFSFLTTTGTDTIPSTEVRTFAYVRSGRSYFEITCRGALARDGLEWAFNYANQYPPSAELDNPGEVTFANTGIWGRRGDQLRKISDNTVVTTTPSPNTAGIFRNDMCDWGLFPFSRLLHEPDWLSDINALGNDPKGNSYRNEYFINDKHWLGLPWVPNGFTKQPVYDATTIGEGGTVFDDSEIVGDSAGKSSTGSGLPNLSLTGDNKQPKRDLWVKRSSMQNDFREFRARDHGPRGKGHDAESSINLASIGITSGEMPGTDVESTAWELWERSKRNSHPYSIPDPSYMHGPMQTWADGYSDIRRSGDFVLGDGSIVTQNDPAIVPIGFPGYVDPQSLSGAYMYTGPWEIPWNTPRASTINSFWGSRVTQGVMGYCSQTIYNRHQGVLFSGGKHWILGEYVSSKVGGMSNTSFYYNDVYIPAKFNFNGSDADIAFDDVVDSSVQPADMGTPQAWRPSTPSLGEAHYLPRWLSTEGNAYEVAFGSDGNQSAHVMAMHDDMPPEIWMLSFADGAVSKWNTSFKDPTYSRFDINHDLYFKGEGPSYNIPASATNMFTQKIGANTSGVCHPYGVVPFDGTTNQNEALHDTGVTIDGTPNISTYFANYSVTNNQSTYIGGAPYKDVIQYEADGTTTKPLSGQTNPGSDAYNHDGAPWYKYYVMRIPAEYVP